MWSHFFNFFFLRYDFSEVHRAYGYRLMNFYLCAYIHITAIRIKIQDISRFHRRLPIQYPVRVTTVLTSITIDVFYQCLYLIWMNYVVCEFSCLASLTQQHVSKIHPCCACHNGSLFSIAVYYFIM